MPRQESFAGAILVAVSLSGVKPGVGTLPVGARCTS
jgi:hypothetical protein